MGYKANHHAKRTWINLLQKTWCLETIITIGNYFYVILLEKLFTEVVRKFPACYGHRGFIIKFTGTRHWTLPWARWIHLGYWYFVSYTKVCLTFVGPCIVIYFCSKTNQLHNISNLFYFGTTLYMFRTFFLSIIRSLRLYIQLQSLRQYIQS
jgi:hypothetical protein